MDFVNKVWYGRKGLIAYLLLPFTYIYRFITFMRRRYLEKYCQKSKGLPLIVVGNINVGGVGKTPLVIELARQYQAKGWRVGIISRGYGASVGNFPHLVKISDSASLVGDEPLLIAEKTQSPVVIAPKRIAAIEYLKKHFASEIIISDDGLQHYQMWRSIEIAVIDGTRALGNGLCLPSGPLRETSRRLKEVDYIVVNQGIWPNSFVMHLEPCGIKQVHTNKFINLADLPKKIAAVAAIGNPQRFYSTLRNLGVNFVSYDFPDHYQFCAQDLDLQEDAIIMTEKDAVKCRDFGKENLYCLVVKAVVENSFWESLWSNPKLIRNF